MSGTILFLRKESNQGPKYRYPTRTPYDATDALPEYLFFSKKKTSTNSQRG